MAVGRMRRRAIASATIAAALALLTVPEAEAGSGGVGSAPHHRHRHAHQHGRRHAHRRRHHRRHRRRGDKAYARGFAPPRGKKFHGVSDTKAGPAGVRHFQRQVGAHPAVLEDFYHWDTPLTTGALQRWRQTRTRGVLSLSTAPGTGGERISPGGIASGRGDHYIVRLNQSIAASGQVVYIRLMPEMNGSWNPYSAFNSDGSHRNRGHSTRRFRRAWRRFAIIVRGGSVRNINHRLKRMGMPRLLRAKSGHGRIYRREGVGKRLDHPKVALIWNPQTISSPDVRGNGPGAYWPGRAYVDWVGADIYSKFATRGVRGALTRFYRSHRGTPFTIGEYSPWDNDYRGSFVRWLFGWAKHHGRAKMVLYYRSITDDSAFDISRYSGARRSLRRLLNQPRWLPHAPGTRRK